VDGEMKSNGARWSRKVGAAAGGIMTYEMNHVSEALAFGLKATTLAERLGSVLLGVAVLFATMFAARHVFGKPFFHGFVVSAGVFLSFDIVLFHWLFQLHRITSGPEADILEPLFVLLGVAMITFGITQERRLLAARMPPAR
jgi:uncharacterized membrane protein